MRYNHRIAKLNDVKNGLTINVNIKVDSGYPLFIMNQEDVNRYMYSDKNVAKVNNPTNVLKDPEYLKEKGEERYVIGCTVESPINSDRVTFYYDRKYKNILIVPDTTHASVLQPTSSHDVMVYELATGSRAHKENDSFPTYSVDERNGVKFPMIGNMANARSLLLSIPGIMPPATTQDANTFEEMINDSINLKRSQRVMLNVVELGTLKEVFPNLDGYMVPLYQCYQFAPCHYRIRHVCNVNPGITEYDNMKVYVNMKF